MSKQLIHYLEKALQGALVLSTTAMVLVILLQVIARFALPWSPDWTEEMARYCFVYMVSLGAGLAFKDQGYVNMAALADKLPVKARLLVESFSLAAIGVLMLTMLAYSFPLLQIVRLQTSAAMQVNMAFIYFSMAAMSFLVMLFAFVQLTQKLRAL